jgi:hypothetical protein
MLEAVAVETPVLLEVQEVVELVNQHQIKEVQEVRILAVVAGVAQTGGVVLAAPAS